MNRSIRITLTSLAALLATATLMASAFAAVDAFINFVKFEPKGPNNDGTLTTDFKAAGLGSKATISLTASADATAVYICVNKSGNFPSDPKKQVLEGPVSTSEQLTSDKNGQLTGDLTLNPPATTLACPSGQHVALAYVSYTNVGIGKSGEVPTEIVSFNYEKLFIDYNT